MSIRLRRTKKGLMAEYNDKDHTCVYQVVIIFPPEPGDGNNRADRYPVFAPCPWPGCKNGVGGMYWELRFFNAPTMLFRRREDRLAWVELEP